MDFTTPSLRSRLASMLYEGMLLFGVLFVAEWLFATLLQQRHALQMRSAAQYWIFLVLGAYFTWFWRHGGQTLAMKTWRIRLVTANGKPLTMARAVWRYLLCWMWFTPGAALAWAIGAKGWMLVLLPALNAVLWALAIRLDPARQFLHDRFAGTRLVSTTPAVASPQPSPDSPPSS